MPTPLGNLLKINDDHLAEEWMEAEADAKRLLEQYVVAKQRAAEISVMIEVRLALGATIRGWPRP